MASDLSTKYTGAVAKDYEGIRSGSDRWANEVAAFEAFYAKTNPAVVLDCPFGTGRWIEQYDASEGQIVGIDVSNDMLNQAETKITPERKPFYQLIPGSVFDFDFSKIEPTPDAVVCVRFLNWISYKEAKTALSQLSASGSRFFILGCSVFPRRAGALKRAVMRTSLALVNFRRPSEPPQFVHDERLVLAHLAELDWRLLDRSLIFRNLSRENYFYLFERST